VSTVIDQVLDEIGDPNGDRTTRADALRYFNRAQRVIATKTLALEEDAYFNLEAAEPRYAYPEPAVVITGVRLSRTSTPTTLADYYHLTESFEEEWRDAIYAGRAEGYISHYRARNNWIEFLQNPSEAIVDGGILSYAKIPAKVATEIGAVMELADFAEDHLIEGMKILARMSTRERAAAQDDWQKWMLAADELKNTFQDRSRDRRPSIRAPRYGNPFAGMR
jgi:hypothetical protein